MRQKKTNKQTWVPSAAETRLWMPGVTIVEKKVNWSSESAWVALTKHNWWGSLNNRGLFSHASWGWKSRSKCWQGCFILRLIHLAVCSHDLFLNFNIYLYLFDCVGSSLKHMGSSIFPVACGIFSHGMQTLTSGVWNLVPWPGIKSFGPLHWEPSWPFWTSVLLLVKLIPT